MDSNLITISSILTTTNNPGLNSSKVDVNKEGSRFSLEPDYNSDKTENIKQTTAYNNADIKPLEYNQQSSEKKLISQKSPETQDGSKSKKQSYPDNKNEEISSNQDVKLPADSLTREGAVSNEPQNGSKLANFADNLKDGKNSSILAKAAKLGDIGQLLQADKKKVELKALLQGKSGIQTGIKNKLTVGHIDTADLKLQEQVKNIGSMIAQYKPGDVIVAIKKKHQELKSQMLIKDNGTQAVNGKKSTANQANVLTVKETGKENPLDKPGKAVVAAGKLSASEANSVKETAKTPESTSETNKNRMEKVLIDDKRLVDKKSNASRGGIESSRIRESINSVNGSTGDSAVQKVNASSVQITNERTKSRININVDRSTNSGISQVTSQSNQTIVTEQNVNSTVSVKAGNQAQPGTTEDISANIGKQILESINRSFTNQGGDKEITVRLNPPELGQVSIKFQEQDTELTGLLEVSKTQTRTEIEQALPQIVRNLSDSGINIKRLEVVLTTGEQAEQEAMRDNSLFNNHQQQQNFSNSGLYGGSHDISGIYEWLSNNINSDNNTGLRNALAVESSINILV